jgi:hypothetical protein
LDWWFYDVDYEDTVGLGVLTVVTTKSIVGLGFLTAVITYSTVGLGVLRR